MLNRTGDRPRSGKAMKRSASAVCKGLPHRGTPPHKAALPKGKEATGTGMPSELDRRFDRKMAEVNGPAGVIAIGRDDKGQAIATNFPATIPGLLDAFCKVNAEHEAIVAGDERFLFPEVAEWSGRLARALVARGVRKGDRVGIAMRNCPA